MYTDFLIEDGAMAKPGPGLRRHLRTIIGSKKVTRGIGPGNDIPFYICPFAPEEQVNMTAECTQLKSELAEDGVSVRELNLFDLTVNLLQEIVAWEELAAFEKDERKDIFLEELQSTINLKEVLIPRIRKIVDDSSFDVLFITGVGEIFPIIRSHLILNNLQSVLKDAPTVIFFPGRYAHGFANGSSLQLFCRLEEEHYYRAHNLLHMREAA